MKDHDKTREQLISKLEKLRKRVAESGRAEVDRQRLSEEKYRVLVENIYDVIFSLDVEGRFTYISPAIEEASLYKAEEVIGQHFARFVHPDDLAGLQAKLEQTLGGDVKPYEFRAVARDGAVTYVRTLSRPFWENGELRGVTGVLTDISKFKQAEEALRKANDELEARMQERTWELIGIIDQWKEEAIERELVQQALSESEQRYRTLFEESRDGVYSVLRDGEVIDANPSFLEIFGYTREETIGKNIGELYADPAAGPKFREEIEKKGFVKDYKVKFQRRDGTDVDCLLTLSVQFGDDGSVVGYHGIIRDVTDQKRADEALRESEELFRKVFEQGPLGMAIVGLDYRCIAINDTFCKMVGYTEAEITKLTLAEITHPDDIEKDLENAQRLLKEEIPVFKVEKRYMKKDGGIVWVNFTDSVVHDDQGRPLYFLSMVEDITERKQTGAALRETEELFCHVFEQGLLGIAIIGLDYRGVAVNATLCEMVGYTEDELTNLSFGDITHPDDIAADVEYLNKLSRGELSSYKREKRYIKKNGEILWVHLTVSVIRDDQGKAVYFLSVIEDITERKRAEVSLRESEDRMSVIIDSSPVGIAIAQDGKYVYVNPALIKMFGYENQEEIVGLDVGTLVAPESREAIRQRVADRTAGKAIPPHFESVGMTKNGNFFEVEGWGTAIEYPGKRSALAFIIDVSEARSLRAQLIQAQKMEAIGNLAGGIAHDFNNLLTVILGYSELIISQKEEGDRDYEDLTKVIHAAETAAEIVKQILAFSHRTESEPQPINLNEQVEQVRKMLSRLIPKTIEVQINLGPDLPVLYADPSQMVQVLMNLAVNARDAMPQGGRLTIQTQTTFLDDDYCRSHIEASQGPHAVLVVTDTGIGIDKALMDRIFEPFFTTKKPGEGTGLGLAMVYGIVKGHGGHITCYSEPGTGTTFKIYLPLHHAGTEPDSPISRESSASMAGTILLVDDEEFVRSLAQRILKKSGCKVITADDGREAVEIYRQKKDEISLVILDLIMPKMDGIKCLDEILRIDPAAKVLIASGFSPDMGTKEALEGRAKGFVGKPYNLKQLLAAVRNAVIEE